MAMDDTRASDVPDERDSNRSLEIRSVVAQDHRLAAKFDRPLTATSVIHSLPGRVRLRVPTLKAYSQLGKGLQALLSDQSGIIEATVITGCQSVTLVYEPSRWNPDSLRGFIETRTSEELELRTSAALADDATTGSALSTNWLQPWRFLNAAELQGGQPVKSGYWTIGYYSMIVGAVLVPVPLVPGIPFLILSSYCFAKATIWKEEGKSEGSEQLPKGKE